MEFLTPGAGGRTLGPVPTFVRAGYHGTPRDRRSAASSRASAFGRSSTAWPRACGLRGFVKNQTGGVLIEVEGEPPRLDRFLAELTQQPAAAGADRRAVLGAAAAARRPRVPHRGQRGRRRRPDLHLAGRRHLRRLPGRAVRPGRPPLSLSLPQLHQLRPAADDHHAAPLRPRAHDDGGVSRCAPPAGRSTTTRPTAASTPSRPPARLRPAACSCSTPRGSRSTPTIRWLASPRRCGRADRRPEGLGGYHLACDARERGGRRANCAAASTATRSRSPSWCADLAAAEALCEVAPAERDLLLSPRRPIVLLRKRRRRR